MPARTDDQQSSSTISTSTTPAASLPSTDSSPQDNKPPAAGNKRALLCGVTYRDAGENIRSLKGPPNDVTEIKAMLIKHFGYTDDQNCIRVLKEEENGNKSTIPTKENIKRSLNWLVEGSESGDSTLVFFFSGHCRQLQRRPHSETDHDHVCLVDCTGNVIPNYDINSTIVRPLKKGVTLYAIVDACHSGSILDLNFEYNKESINAEGRWIEKKSDDDQSKAEKGTSGGLAICLSACRDDRTATETNANSSGKGKGAEMIMGAMTYHLIQNIDKLEHPANVTYGHILKEMHNLHEIRNIKTEPISKKKRNGKEPFGSSLLHKHSESRKIEIPVLSSSDPKFQVSSEKFLQAALLM